MALHHNLTSVVVIPPAVLFLLEITLITWSLVLPWGVGGASANTRASRVPIGVRQEGILVRYYSVDSVASNLESLTPGSWFGHV